METNNSRHLLLADYVRLKEYATALEATRRDLWGVNEELRTKIAALEQGQLELQDIVIRLRCSQLPPIKEAPLMEDPGQFPLFEPTDNIAYNFNGH